MTLDRKQVEHIALLSRLKLTDEEIEKFTGQLDGILHYVEKLEELDTADVPPMFHAIDHVNIWREDVVEEALPVDEALANAAEREEDFIKVPKVTE